MCLAKKETHCKYKASDHTPKALRVKQLKCVDVLSALHKLSIMMLGHKETMDAGIFFDAV